VTPDCLEDRLSDDGLSWHVLRAGTGISFPY
jgi:hypothetical protein